jgi:hypothetical protein
MDRADPVAAYGFGLDATSMIQISPTSFLSVK